MACTLKLTLGGHTAKVLRRKRLCCVARSVAICRPSLRRIYMHHEAFMCM